MDYTRREFIGMVSAAAALTGVACGAEESGGSADALAGGVAHLRYRVRRVEPRTPAPPRPRAPAQGRRAPNRPEWRSVRDKAR